MGRFGGFPEKNGGLACTLSAPRSKGKVFELLSSLEKLELAVSSPSPQEFGSSIHGGSSLSPDIYLPSILSVHFEIIALFALMRRGESERLAVPESQEEHCEGMKLRKLEICLVAWLLFWSSAFSFGILVPHSCRLYYLHSG